MDKKANIQKSPPILFLVFNRPDNTERVFKAIRQGRPKRLYIAADGPRSDQAGESVKCDEVRRIAQAVDWDCDVKTLFRSKNLGCGLAVSTAIDWFFEHEDEGIILEDDCLPSASFFPYCAELLEYYRNDTRIMQIGGNNIGHHVEDTYSYTFSNQSYIWGWATWKRAWKLYDFNMNDYRYLKDGGYLEHYYNTPYEKEYKRVVYESIIEVGKVKKTWDYQWDFARVINSGLCIIPKKNLVVNIGFGTNATHTKSANKKASYLQSQEIRLPLKHPKFMMVNQGADNNFFRSYFTSFWWRLRLDIKKLIPNTIVKRVEREWSLTLNN